MVPGSLEPRLLSRVPDRRLIVTGDDFGLALPVNEAIEAAHRGGILRAASLMVAGRAADDAMARAQRLPDLAVGLHLVLVEGKPVLPPEQIPDLVTTDGAFLDDLFAAGVRFFFRAGARAQLRAEIRAQFEAFAGTGLVLDHVNAHNHMHLHPTVSRIVLEIGRDFGMRAIRVPYEPVAWPPAGVGFGTQLGRAAASLGLAPFLGLLRARSRREGLRFNDRVLGLHQSGAMDERAVLALLDRLQGGVTEMYFHAATRRCPEIDAPMPDYRHEDELAALLSQAVRAKLEHLGVQPIAFGDLSRGGDPRPRGAELEDPRCRSTTP